MNAQVSFGSVPLGGEFTFVVSETTSQQGKKIEPRGISVINGPTNIATVMTVNVELVGNNGHAFLADATLVEFDVVARAKQFVSEHIGDELRPLHVSSALGVGNCLAFLRLFEEATGERFADFVKGVRVEKARVLILNPRHKEAEIALMVGFTNVTTFRRAFRKIHGESPTEYRKRIPINLQRTD